MKKANYLDFFVYVGLIHSKNVVKCKKNEINENLPFSLLYQPKLCKKTHKISNIIFFSIGERIYFSNFSFRISERLRFDHEKLPQIPLRIVVTTVKAQIRLNENE